MLARNREGRLDDRLPTETVDPGDDRFDQPCMRRIQKPIETFALPTHLQVEGRPEPFDRAPKRVDLDVVEAAGLDLGNELPR